MTNTQQASYPYFQSIRQVRMFVCMLDRMAKKPRFSADWIRLPGTARQYGRPLADGSYEVISRAEYGKVLDDPTYQPRTLGVTYPDQDESTEEDLPPLPIETGKKGRPKKPKIGPLMNNKGEQTGWIEVRFDLVGTEQVSVTRQPLYRPAQDWIDKNLPTDQINIDAVALGLLIAYPDRVATKTGKKYASWLNVMPNSDYELSRERWTRLNYFSRIYSIAVRYLPQ